MGEVTKMNNKLKIIIEQMEKFKKSLSEINSIQKMNYMGNSRSKYLIQNEYNTTKRLIPIWFLDQKNRVPVKVGKKHGRNDINPNTGRKYKFDK